MNKFTNSGIPANYHNQVEGSKIDHIHRWTNAKRLNKLENGSKLIILRCRRCELMKSTEIFVEYKEGRAIAKRVDRIIGHIEPIEDQIAPIEHPLNEVRSKIRKQEAESNLTKLIKGLSQGQEPFGKFD